MSSFKIIISSPILNVAFEHGSDCNCIYIFFLPNFFKKKKKKVGAGKEAPWPRSLVAFAAEDPDPIPRTYLVGHNFL